MDPHLNDLKQLNSLDPARGREPTAVEWTRSRAMLERVISGRAPQPSPSRPVRRRLVVGVAVAAAGAVAAVTVPSLLPGTAEKAFASWTAAPGSLTGEQVLPQARACAGNGRGGPSTAGPADVLLAEQRGLATLLIMKKDSGVIDLCLSAGPGSDDQLASMSLADGPLPAPPADTVTLETMASVGEGDGRWSDIVGLAGTGVTRVDVRPDGGKSFQASVRNGWWAAWWPGPEGGEADALTVTVHTATGTTDHRVADLD
ncbi:hypothetical protein Asp14428_24930 [Actinoplanes sp. NBRC 14428]|nr:hypothetical protein Asp14428_24930 [Actinoplanes sp. NBRC 14428]